MAKGGIEHVCTLYSYTERRTQVHSCTGIFRCSRRVPLPQPASLTNLYGFV